MFHLPRPLPAATQAVHRKGFAERKRPYVKNEGRLSGVTPGLIEVFCHLTFLIEMWTAGGLTCLLFPLWWHLQTQSSLSLTTFGNLSPANMITAPLALLGGKQKHIFGLIILSHNQWSREMFYFCYDLQFPLFARGTKTSLNNLYSYERNKK